MSPDEEKDLHWRWVKCLTCGKDFIPLNPDHTFCSDECALKYRPMRKMIRSSRYTEGTQTRLGEVNKVK